MRHSKLYHYLQYLDRPQLSGFARYLSSPLHNQKPETLQLFELVRKELLSSEGRNISEEETYAVLFPGNPYNQTQLRKLKSETLEHLLRYLELEDFWMDEPAQRLRRLRVLNRLQEDQFFEQGFRLAWSALEKEKDSIRSLEQRAAALLERYSMEVHQPSRRPSDALAEVHALQADYHAAMELRIAYLALNQSSVTGQPPQAEASESAVQRCRERFDQLPREARAYFLLYLTRLDPEDKASYQKLKDLLEFDGKKAPEWSRDLVTGALNHAAASYNAGNTEFLLEIHEWHRRALVEGGLVENGKLLASHLKNAVSVACKLGRIDWAEALVERWGNHVVGDQAEHAQTHNKGVIALHRRDYDKAYTLLNAALVGFQDHFYGLDARVLMLQAVYLGGEKTLAESLCHASRMYLQRHQHLSKARKKRYLTFVRHYQRLLECPPRDRKRLQKLRQDVFQKADTPAKNWLLLQIDGLLGEIGA